MQKFLNLGSIALLVSLLTACTNFEFPGVYKLTIEQGNIITQDMVDQLKPGMSKSQVEYVMGTPLIKDTFNSERGDYVFNIERGSQPREQQRLTILFDGNKLKSFSGDFIPSSAREIDLGTEENPHTLSDS